MLHIHMDALKIRQFYKENNLDRGLLNFINSARIIIVHYLGLMKVRGNFKDAKWRHVEISHNGERMKLDTWSFNLLLCDLCEDLIKAIENCSGRVNVKNMFSAADVPAVQKKLMGVVRKGEPLISFPGIPYDLHASCSDLLE